MVAEVSKVVFVYIFVNLLNIAQQNWDFLSTAAWPAILDLCFCFELSLPPSIRLNTIGNTVGLQSVRVVRHVAFGNYVGGVISMKMCYYHRILEHQNNLTIFEVIGG